MPEYTYASFPPFIDLSQSHWVDLLLPLDGLEVAKFGTTRTENIKSICSHNPKALSCIGEKNHLIEDNFIEYYDSIDDIYDNKSFDLVVIDESDFFYSSESKVDFFEKIRKICAILKREGRVVICVPDRMQDVKYRFWLKQILTASNFLSVETYLCQPSTELPLKIIPLLLHPKWTISYLSRSFSGDESSRYFMPLFRKNIVKYLLRLFTIYLPFYGLLFIACKSLKRGSSGLARISEKINIAESKIEGTHEPFTIVFSSQRYLPKHFLFIYKISNSKLLMVGKLFFHKYHKFHKRVLPKQEYENLIFISSRRSVLEKKKIKVPEPLYLEISESTTLYFESAVSGFPLNELAKKYLLVGDDRAAIIKLLGELVEVQMTIQEELSKDFVTTNYSDISCYFENYLGFPIEEKELGIIEEFSSKTIQHGDYSDVNIFCDLLEKNYGIIDWEWMARGYPPLFDLFSLFRSIGFLEHPNVIEGEFENYILSFIDSFFKDNWFSRYEKTLIQSYCDRFNISPSLVFDCFIRYLLFHSNKNRLHSNVHDFQKMFEKMLNYAFQHKKEFFMGKM